MGHGTGRSYIIQRLRQDQHDVLLRGVLNGQITAHQAAIQAGYTKPRPIKAKHEAHLIAFTPWPHTPRRALGGPRLRANSLASHG